jgi:hypothetical protein
MNLLTYVLVDMLTESLINNNPSGRRAGRSAAGPDDRWLGKPADRLSDRLQI